MDLEKTKGMVESDISKALTRWEKEYLGRGSVQVKTHILQHMILISLKGVLSPAEKELTKTEAGMLSIKKIRSELIETGSPQLKRMIVQLTGCEVESFHTDISTRTGERIIVFVLKDNLEKRLTE